MAYQKISMTEEASNSVKNDSDAFLRDHATEEFANQVPVTYINSLGTYVFRVFPDMYKGHVRTFRPIFMHNINLKNAGPNGKDFKFRCVNDERISKLLSNFTDEQLGGNREAWKYKSKENGLMLVRIYSAPTSDAYTKKMIEDTGRGFVDAIVVLSASMMKEVQSRISELDSKNRIEFLDIDTPSVAIKLSITKESNADNSRQWNVGSATFTRETYALGEPIFPEGAEWDGLDQAYIPSNRVITDTELAVLTRYLNAVKNRNSGYVNNTSADGFLSIKPMSLDDELPSWEVKPSASESISDEIPF